MFAPTGYVSFGRVLDALSEAASSEWSQEMHRRYSENERLWDDDMHARKWFHVRELRTAWMLARVLSGSDAHAASPQGHLVELDHWVVTHAERLSWYDWEWPDKNYNGELSVSLEIQSNDWRCGPLSRFLFIDSVTGTLAAGRRRVWLENEEERTGDPLLAQAAALAPLEGWAICFPREGVADLDSTALISNSTKSSATRRPGRPPKVPALTAAYLQVFPDGHEGILREQVARHLQPIVGQPFSLDTLDRAIETAKGMSGK